MSSAPLQNLVSSAVDGFELARSKARIVGELALSDLPRLADLLAERQGRGELAGGLLCRLEGRKLRQETGKIVHLIDLSVSGCLRLICQRCLDPFDFECRIERRLMLLRPGEPWPEDELFAEDYDAIEVTGEIVLRDLIEEEILLALPIVPRHDACALPAGRTFATRPSPFAALAGLMNKH